MPRINYNIEIQLDRLLVSRITAHLDDRIHPDFAEMEAQALSFIRNAMHQNTTKTKNWGRDIAKAMVADFKRAWRGHHFPRELTRRHQPTHELIDEFLVQLGCWNRHKVLSPAFANKLGLEDQ